MASLTVFVYRFQSEAASLGAYQAVMRLIAGGSAYRLRTPDGSRPPMLVVFAIGNAAQIQAACEAAGGTVTSIEPQLLASLAERSLHAAQRGVTGQRHYAPGTPPGEALPDNPGDYTRPQERRDDDD